MIPPLRVGLRGWTSQQHWSFTARRFFPAGTRLEITKVGKGGGTGRLQAVALDGSGEVFAGRLLGVAWDAAVVDDDRRCKQIARYPDRRGHEFWSPWPTASQTRCERCGVYFGEHGETPDDRYDRLMATDPALRSDAEEAFVEDHGAALAEEVQ